MLDRRKLPSPLPAVSVAVMLYETDWGAELNTSAHFGQFTPVYHLQVPAQAGQIILATASACFTNPIAGNALCSTSIVVSDAPLAVSDGLSGTVIARDSGLNISENMHHWTPDRTGFYKAPAAGNYWVTFLVYWDPDYGLDGKIEGTYGRLQVIVI